MAGRFFSKIKWPTQALQTFKEAGRRAKFTGQRRVERKSLLYHVQRVTGQEGCEKDGVPSREQQECEHAQTDTGADKMQQPIRWMTMLRQVKWIELFK